MFDNTECKVDLMSRFVNTVSQRYHSGALALLLPLNGQSVNVNLHTVGHILRHVTPRCQASGSRRCEGKYYLQLLGMLDS
jgi:hypothetical protein